MDGLKGYMEKNGIEIRQREIREGVYESKLTINGEQVGTMETVIDENANVVPSAIRSTDPTEVRAILVKWIIIEDDTGLRGKGLGSILLMHELFSICKQHPDIKWAVLDDDSDQSQHLKNIYAKLGFEFCDHCSITDKGRVKSSGPEKQLNITKVDWEQKAGLLLKKLEKKAKSTGSGGGTKASKTKTKTKSLSRSDSDVSLGGKVRKKTKNKKQKQKRYTLRR
jgi:hypothetical protein